MAEDVPASAEPLDFEHADVPAEAQEMSCAACSRSIVATYYGVNGKFICPACHKRLIAARLDEGSFMSALGLGIGAATLSAGAYYAITLALRGTQIGFMALFLGVIIGKAVRKGAGLHPGRHYRVMAMVLAYMAITATYIPCMKADGLHSVVAATLLSWVVPFFMLAKMQNILGSVILAIGVYEAWKLSAAPQLLVQGPFTLEAPSQTSAPVR